jgi:hypothetical protein
VNAELIERRSSGAELSNRANVVPNAHTQNAYETTGA